jgi:hypothetical protein
MKQRLPESPAGQWTRADAYFAALARKRTARRGREPKERRTQPEAPRFVLSTLPYLALSAALAVLAVAIAVTAFPGSQPAPKAKAMAAREPGVAEKGWLQNAEREFHR